jgi:hypothetical protein
MITKKSIVLFAIYSLSNSTIIGMHNEQDVLRQKAFCRAVQNNNAERALIHAGALKTPIFTLAVDGTRTVRQVNALNYAIRVFADQQDSRLLSVLLKRVNPSDLKKVIEYQDQGDNKAPQDVIDELFNGIDAFVLLGMFTKKTSAPYLNSEEPLVLE